CSWCPTSMRQWWMVARSARRSSWLRALPAAVDTWAWLLAGIPAFRRSNALVALTYIGFGPFRGQDSFLRHFFRHSLVSSRSMVGATTFGMCTTRSTALVWPSPWPLYSANDAW